jgi:patatin-like phospholipase/acyl hydrolase
MAIRILTLSGGGIRGIFQAVFLREISLQLQSPLREHFDLIAGTSTGAIVALGVALNIDLKKIVGLFEDDGFQIFPKSTRVSRQRLASYACRGPAYKQEPLRRILREVFTDKHGSQL